MWWDSRSARCHLSSEWAQAPGSQERPQRMTNNDSVLDIAIDVLACSFAGQLLKIRRNEWLPHGARWALGGVAMAEDGTFMGWMA